MTHPRWDTETTETGGDIGGDDWNNARKLATEWDDKALSTNTISITGDGKYRVTYSGAQNLDTITETGGDAGYVVIIKADVTGAGAALTIRSGQDNIYCSQGVNIVLASDEEWAMFVQHGSNFYGGKMYESGA